MKVVELSGGVGGARMAVGFAALEDIDFTVVVNVGDDEEIHGLHVSPDLDTVVYTLAGLEGPEGWGRSGDTFTLNNELARFGVDNTFRLGDLDLALNLYRTNQLDNGHSLTEITATLTSSFNVRTMVLPVSDDRLRTLIRTQDEEWISFQEYFVIRQSRDEVAELRFDGASTAQATSEVLEAISTADHVVIAPSNPPLSIWPLLAVGEIRDLVESHPSVTAISPLFRGRALKGPADRVMASLGLPSGNLGVAAAYEDLIDRLVIDTGDAPDANAITHPTVLVADTRIKHRRDAMRLARTIVEL
ncbi:MAG: 2-phospho-L-lactate transferase [Acidimicrobiia bacterium]